MNARNSLVAIVVVCGMAFALGYAGRLEATRSRMRRRDPAAFAKMVAGFKVHLIAIVDTDSRKPQSRLADHAWTPDGFPYEGPEARLTMRTVASAPSGGSRRSVYFELEQPKKEEQVGLPPETTVDVLAYLPNAGKPGDYGSENPGAAGPAKIQISHFVPRDSGGNAVLAAPACASMDLGLQGTAPQTVIVGIAQKDFKIIAKGPTPSIAGIAVNQTTTLASGPWGRIEVTHLPRPQVESKPSPTHRFRLFGGAFPPKAERAVLFFDANGNQIASCGDGPNNAGYMGPWFRGRASPEPASYEIQERPYDFVRFEGVSFEAPQFKGYSGDQGLAHEVDSSIGKVVGVLKPTKDGPWTGSVLYAADGTRWIDPGPDLAAYGFGMFDPWDHPLLNQWNILFEPGGDLSSTSPTNCEVFAADSPEGPTKERLTTWNEMSFRSPMTQITCRPSPRPYMLIHVRTGGGEWKTLDTVTVTDDLLQRAETGALGSRVLEADYDDDGGMRIWQGGAEPVRLQSTWRPGEQRIRVIAHLRSGGTVEADLNMSSYGGAQGHERRTRGLYYTRQVNGTLVHSGSKNIDIRDISEFDLQVQDLKPALSIPVHSPVD